jgi:hypothetical protein
MSAWQRIHFQVLGDPDRVSGRRALTRIEGRRQPSSGGLRPAKRSRQSKSGARVVIPRRTWRQPEKERIFSPPRLPPLGVTAVAAAKKC